IEDELRRQALDLLPQVAQRIRDFHRVKVDKGRKIWEVSAREAQYHDDENVVVVMDPAVSFYADDGREVAVRSREGKVSLQGHDLQWVDVSGDIEIRFGDYALRTDRARYDRSQGTIVVPGAVEISGRELQLRGDHLALDVAAQKVHMSDNVRMVLHAQTDSAG